MEPIATVAGILLGTVASVNLFTVPAGKTFVFLGLVIRSVLGGTYGQDGNQNVQRLSDGANMISINGNYPNVADTAAVNWQTGGETLVDSGDTVVLEIASPDSSPSPSCSVDLFGYLV